MPRKIVDLSARSNIIRQEPFGLHFWECSPKEYLVSVAKPHFATQDRDFSGEMGAVLADQTVAGYHRCRSFHWRSRISNREGATVPRLAYLCSNAFKRLVVGPTIVSSARTQSSANC